MKPDNDTNGVIYLEADEDITAAIDKLTKSAAQRVQMVTTKRSNLFQSVINLKLLQKAAKDAKKSLVLVTSDRVATNLAGRLGVAVASQVGEAAKIPTAAAAVQATSVDDEIDGGEIDQAETMPAPTPIKPAASAAAIAAAKNAETAPTAPVIAPETPAPNKPEKPKGQRVPNVGKMQKRIMWVGLALAVIIGLFGLSYFMTRATVTLYAQASQGHASFNFTADPTAQQSDTTSGTLSAEQLTMNKTLTTNVVATGTKDQGTKASGTMTVYNNYDSSSHTLVSGTRFVSPGGLVFRSTQDATVPGGSLSHGQPVAGQTTVPVEADANGDQYNLAPAKYSIPGLASDQQSGIYGQGAQMQGGTTKTTKIITQADVDKAQAAALSNDKEGAAKALAGKAKDQQVAIDATLVQTVSSSDANPNVGSEGASATLTIQAAYTELAVQKTALSDLAKAKEGAELGPQSEIYDDGVGAIQFTLVGAPAEDGSQKLKADTTAYSGTKIDTDALKKSLKGQKGGEAITIAQQVPGVDKAEVKISPSWATGMPRILKHIKVEIKVSNAGS